MDPNQKKTCTKTKKFIMGKKGTTIPNKRIPINKHRRNEVNIKITIRTPQE